MQEFTGIQYMKIAIANAFGLDGITWDKRLHWYEINKDNLIPLAERAKEKFLYIKAVSALDDALAGKATGYIMSLDATASGAQIIACLMGCYNTALNVNLVNTGEREDLYENVAKIMGSTRKIVKKPTMTTFYASEAQPKEVFNPAELDMFYKTLNRITPLCMRYLSITKGMHRPDATSYSWILPDGHVAHVLTKVKVDNKIEVAELNKSTFTYRHEVNAPKKDDKSLAANIVQSIDAFVVREMERLANLQGFELLTVHDSFWASPNHMNKVRRNYREILAGIARIDLFESIIYQVTGSTMKIDKPCTNLSDFILQSEYMLS